MSPYNSTECYRCQKRETTHDSRYPHDWFKISKFEIDGISVTFTEPRFACSLSCLKDLISEIRYEITNRIPRQH